MHLIGILGQTCSGKSEMAVSLAQNLKDSWIVNCDSRQIYQRLNLGTGRINGKWKEIALGQSNSQAFVYKDIPHFLIDYIDPAQHYNLSQYLYDWITLFSKFSTNLPKYVILTGGTGLYAQCLFQEYPLFPIKKEFQSKYHELKRKLWSRNRIQLQQKYDQLRAIYPDNAQLNSSDFRNPTRLINWILRTQVIQNHWHEPLQFPQFERKSLYAITAQPDELKIKIQKRLFERIQLGLLDEVIHLLDLGYDRIKQFGLEYRQTALYLQGYTTKEQWMEAMLKENFRYAKRQLTWLNKENLTWINTIDDIIIPQ